jgi:hypothetical protein
MMVPHRAFFRSVTALAFSLLLFWLASGEARATILSRHEVACPVCEQKFKAVVASSADTSAGVDRDLFARSAGPQPVFYKISTCPRCYYSGYIEDFRPGIQLPADFRDKVLKSPKLDPKMAITPKTDQRSIPAEVRYRLAVQCHQWRNMQAESMAWLYLRASWVARDVGSVIPRTDRLQRVMGYIERWLPADTRKLNQADRELQLVTHVSAAVAEGQFSQYQLPYVQFILAMLWRRHGENHLFETVFPPGTEDERLPESLREKVRAVHASIEQERKWQRLALEQFRRALDTGEIAAANRPAAEYVVAELYRRLEQPNRAMRFYDRALAAPQLDAHLAEWARQQRRLVAPGAGR